MTVLLTRDCSTALPRKNPLDKRSTVVVTLCDRLDLLKQTLESLIKWGDGIQSRTTDIAVQHDTTPTE
jgi:hypothetical protein